MTENISPAGIEALVARARGFDFAPSVLGLAVATESEWRSILATSSRERVNDIVDELNRLEAQQRQAEDDAVRQRNHELARGAEPNAEERRQIEEMRANDRATGSSEPNGGNESTSS